MKMKATAALATILMFALGGSGAFAQPLPGGTLDPTVIPKYVTPLVIPPVMDDAATAAGDPAMPDEYENTVRQNKQQILPAGI